MIGQRERATERQTAAHRKNIEDGITSAFKILDYQLLKVAMKKTGSGSTYL